MTEPMVGRASIDGKDFYTEFGVIVEKITGDMDQPKIKEPLARRWDDDHGDDVYLDKIFLESKNIQIACYIEGSSAAGYVSKINTFFKALIAPKARFLRVRGNTLGYLVYLREATPITRLTDLDSGKVIGRFTITLNNFCPVNRQFIRNNTVIEFTISCTKPVTIYWCDGLASVVKGTGQVRTKIVSADEKLDIVIYGPVDTINSLAVVGAVEVT
jgi:hypothetical protein